MYESEGLLESLNAEVANIRAAMRTFHEKGCTFEEVRILLVNQLKITMGEATDRLKMYEEISGIKLAR